MFRNNYSQLLAKVMSRTLAILDVAVLLSAAWEGRTRGAP